MRANKGYTWRAIMLIVCLSLSGYPLGRSTQSPPNAVLLVTSQKTSPHIMGLTPRTVPHVVQPFMTTHNIKKYVRHYLKGK